MLNSRLDDSKGFQIVPHYRPRGTSKAPRSLSITDYERKGFNLSGSVLRAHRRLTPHESWLLASPKFPMAGATASRCECVHSVIL